MVKKILVVEDGADVRSVVVALLTRICGYQAIEAANGNEAVAKAVSEEPDLILMDVSLPDISGIDAARAVKRNPKTAHIPIANGLELGSMESSSAGGRNGGLPAKAGVNGDDHINNRKVPLALLGIVV